MNTLLYATKKIKFVGVAVLCPTCGAEGLRSEIRRNKQRWRCKNKHRWTAPLEITGSPSQSEGDFNVQLYDTMPTANTIEQLLDSKCKKFQERLERFQEERITTFAAGSKPIGILHFGDPHLDDNGCDLPLLRQQIALIQSESGILCGNIGDNTNNWVGRLAKLYAIQSTTFEEGLQLCLWLMRSCKWLYFVNGNHDHWNEGTYILNLLMQGSRVAVNAAHEARIELCFNNGVIVRLVARHDMKGRSIWHTTHGAKREGTLDPWGDLFIAGHTHEWGSITWEGRDAKPRTGIRVRGFKRMDDFALEKGFYEHQHGAACLTIINPYAPPTERIHCHWDVAYGIRVLRMLRA